MRWVSGLQARMRGCVWGKQRTGPADASMPSHAWATALGLTPYLLCICVTQPGAALRIAASMAGFFGNQQRPGSCQK